MIYLLRKHMTALRQEGEEPFRSLSVAILMY